MKALCCGGTKRGEHGGAGSTVEHCGSAVESLRATVAYVALLDIVGKLEGVSRVHRVEIAYP